jgi:hypothetical protein
LLGASIRSIAKTRRQLRIQHDSDKPIAACMSRAVETRADTSESEAGPPRGEGGEATNRSQRPSSPFLRMKTEIALECNLREMLDDHCCRIYVACYQH